MATKDEVYLSQSEAANCASQQQDPPAYYYGAWRAPPGAGVVYVEEDFDAWLSLTLMIGVFIFVLFVAILLTVMLPPY
jgi:hypothetical protein